MCATRRRSRHHSAVEARDARITELEREQEAIGEDHRQREAQLHRSCQSKLDAMRELHAAQLSSLRREFEVQPVWTLAVGLYRC